MEDYTTRHRTRFGLYTLLGLVLFVFVAPVAAQSAPNALFGNVAYHSQRKVVFTDFSTGNPDTWVWDFGDYIQTVDDTGDPITHIYTDWGTYHVCLTVINAYGEDTDCLDVELVDPSTIWPTPTAMSVPAATPVLNALNFTTTYKDMAETGVSYWNYLNTDGAIDLILVFLNLLLIVGGMRMITKRMKQI